MFCQYDWFCWHLRHVYEHMLAVQRLPKRWMDSLKIPRQCFFFFVDCLPRTKTINNRTKVYSSCEFLSVAGRDQTQLYITSQGSMSDDLDQGPSGRAKCKFIHLSRWATSVNNGHSTCIMDQQYIAEILNFHSKITSFFETVLQSWRVFLHNILNFNGTRATGLG